MQEMFRFVWSRWISNTSMGTNHFGKCRKSVLHPPQVPLQSPSAASCCFVFAPRHVLSAWFTALLSASYPICCSAACPLPDLPYATHRLPLLLMASLLQVGHLCNALSPANLKCCHQLPSWYCEETVLLQTLCFSWKGLKCCSGPLRVQSRLVWKLMKYSIWLRILGSPYAPLEFIHSS